MDNQNRNEWVDIMRTDWMISKTFQYLTICELQYLRNTNSAIKAAIDSFIDELPGYLPASIGFRGFTALASYLSINDLNNLNLVSKGSRFALRAYARNLPPGVKALIPAWCGNHPPALFMYSFECFRQEQLGFILYHPPFLKISLGPMTFDQNKSKLVGQPIEEVQVNNAPPPNLGRFKAFACSTDDTGSEIFYCGGGTFIEGHHHDQWIMATNLNLGYNTTTALFDVATGLWRELPPMPEPRMDGAICRVGRKVLIIGGVVNPSFNQFVLVFDLDEECWLPDHGIQSAIVEQFDCHVATASDNENAIVLAGLRLFSLNVTSRQWTELPSLPLMMLLQCGGTIVSMHIVRNRRLRGPLLVALGDINYAVTILWPPAHRPGEEWILEPDLCDYGLPKMMRFHMNTVQVFSGDGWEWMETDEITRPLFYRGHIVGGNLASETVRLTQFSLRQI